jgi:hypothetical protein
MDRKEKRRENGEREKTYERVMRERERERERERVKQ